MNLRGGKSRAVRVGNFLADESEKSTSKPEPKNFLPNFQQIIERMHESYEDHRLDDAYDAMNEASDFMKSDQIPEE